MTRRFKRLLAGSLALTVGCTGHATAPAVTLLPAPHVVAGTLDGQDLVRDAAVRALTAGAGPLSIVAVGEAAERERLGAFVDIPPDVCLLAYGRASGSVDDLDLAAFSEEGTPTAVDDGPDPHPTLLLCPPHPARVYLAAVAASGEGLVAVAAHLVPVARAAAVGKVMDAHGTRTASTRAADAWPGLDDQVRKHHEAIGGKWELLRKVALTVDPRLPSTVAFPLEPNGCTDALIVPDEDVGSLEVEALDDHGRVVARGNILGRQRNVTVCSPVGWSGSLTLRPHAGQGLAVVVLSRGKADIARDLTVSPDVAWAAAERPLAEARAKRASELRAAGYGGAAGFEEGKLLVGSTHSSLLTVGHQSACTRIDVSGGAPLALIAAGAWDDQGNRLASAEGSSSATLFTCGADKARLDLEARARPGPYAVEWRPERWSDPAFAAHPLAAARMLTRTTLGPTALLEGTASDVRAFHANAGHETTWSAVIPATSCLRVVAAGEGAGSGLEGRIVDAANGEELDRAAASEAVALRACADEATSRSVVISMQVTAGALDVVVGSRLIR